MVQKASIAVAASLATALTATGVAAQDDNFVTWGPDPIESYDVCDGPEGINGACPDAQEVLEPFIQGLTDMAQAAEQGIIDGDAVSDFFIVPIPAEEIKKVDPESFVDLATSNIEPACEVLDEEGLHGCTAAYLNIAGGFGDAAIGYITTNVPESSERSEAIDKITRICSTAITNISNSTFADNFEYAQVGITAASMCMVVTEDHGKAAGVGIDFLPSTRGYVLESAQADRDATANFTRPAGP